MSFIEGIKLAIRMLWANKMRSGLTTLGVIIGVSAIIVVLAVGEGGKALVISELEALGSNLIWVYRERLAHRSLSLSEEKRLTYEDVIALKKGCSYIKNAAPILYLFGEVTYGKVFSKHKSVFLVSTTPEFQTVRKIKLKKGRFINDKDLKNKQNICVLGEKISKDLFGKEDPRGRIILLEGAKFKVVGVLAKKRRGMFVIEEIDDYSIYIPLTSGQYLAETKEVDIAYLEISDAKRVGLAEKEIKKILKLKFKDDNIRVQKMEEILNYVKKVTSILAIMIGSVAVISLMVGGIGIMNIMLVSVTERTREIGLRKAVGAKKRDILFQFLIEAVVLSVGGGIIGILLGIGETVLISKIAVVFLKDIPHWPPLITFKSVLLAFLFSVSIGIFFGFYPAHRAAKLEPAEALRYE